MIKKTKILLSVLMSLIFVLSFTGCTEDDYARITDVEYKAIVADEESGQGTILITEKLTFDVHAADYYNGFWELWRDLPESYVDGVKVDYKVKSVKQIMPDGTEVVWEESPKLYWDDYDYVEYNPIYGPEKWFHSKGPYNEDRRQYECLLFYVNDLYREKVTFEIEYEMNNAVLAYADCAELYVSLYSGDTCKYLKSFKGEFLIPEEKMPKEGNYVATTYGTNSFIFDFEESSTKNKGYHTFYFELDEEDLKFKNFSEYIEFALVSYNKDKHAFAKTASINDYYFDNVLDDILAEQEYYTEMPERIAKTKLILLILSIISSTIIAATTFIPIRSFKKKYPYYSTKEVDTFYRDIPSNLDPKFAAALVFAKEKPSKLKDSDAFAAVLLSLARKEYVSIEDNGGTDIKITLADNIFANNLSTQPVNTANREPLTINEVYCLNLLRRHADKQNNMINLSVLQRKLEFDYDYARTYTASVKSSVIECGVGLGYMPKPFWQEPKIKMKNSATTRFLMAIIFMLVQIICIAQAKIDSAYGAFAIIALSFALTSVYLSTQSHKYVLLTQFGEEEYKKWRGLYNFLKSDTLLNERTYLELPLWEKYLVYATAFGISEKVIKAIHLRCPEIPNSKSIVMNTCCRTGRIHVSSTRIHNSVRSSSQKHYYSSTGGHSSGYSSHHYGGGGRGGGGGGGGH